MRQRRIPARLHGGLAPSAEIRDPSISSYRFEDLEVYGAAREFRKKIYLLIKRLPSEEKHNLVAQMRRAATSLTNNIAEGHGRFHYQENIQ